MQIHIVDHGCLPWRPPEMELRLHVSMLEILIVLSHYKVQTILTATAFMLLNLMCLHVNIMCICPSPLWMSDQHLQTHVLLMHL